MDWIWERLVDLMLQIGMPLIIFYHTLTSSLFFNVAADDASGLEKAGNQLLIPYHYLFVGKDAIREKGEEDDFAYRFEQRFEYQSHFALKTSAAILTIVPSTALGTACKGLAFFDPKVRKRYDLMQQCLSSTKVKSHRADYQKIGLKIGLAAESFTGQNLPRRPGDEEHLSIEKKALREIARLLNAAGIPWWVDCGTCLGTYRYGGVIPWDFDIDIAVLLPDFENVERALHGLDPDKYCVQDWSSRQRPHTYLKVYIYETDRMIDIYHFAIRDLDLQYVFSCEENIFLPEWCKASERKYTAPVAFDTVFPLRKSTFDGIEIFIPNDPKKFLQRYYGKNLSPVKIYNKETCQYEKDLSHPYWKEVNAH